jgi:hypothetical protein
MRVPQGRDEGSSRKGGGFLAEGLLKQCSDKCSWIEAPFFLYI